MGVLVPSSLFIQFVSGMFASDKREFASEAGRTCWPLARVLAPVLGLAFLVSPVVAADRLQSFAEPDLSAWKQMSFKGHSQYKLVEFQSGIRALQGKTDGQASVLYRESPVDLASTPWLQWNWKVDNVYPEIDEQSKRGDDFPARLYVVARTGVLPWQTHAINYVWASRLPVGEAWKSPYTEKAVMIAVDSGQHELGNWVFRQRNVAADFKQYFDLEIDKLDGYAVMVDGDNTGLQATAWFGDIRFSAAPR